jgi:hypothetical protein
MEYHGKQCTLVLYVDDYFVNCVNPEALDFVQQKIIERYGGCTRHDGDVLPFLGIMMDFRESGVMKMTMPAYVQDIIRESAVKTIADTPAAANLFTVDSNAKSLNEEEKERFHCDVAKDLYLAKRTRPDILLPINFLTTRVLNPTEDDQRKIRRVHRYLAGTSEMALTLGIGDEYTFAAYIDASYAVHDDMRSHSGMVYFAGKGGFLCTSKK